MAKTFTSPLKLRRLPLGSQIRFGEAPYGRVWIKVEGGWLSRGSSFPLPFNDADVIRYNDGRPYTVESVGSD